MNIMEVVVVTMTLQVWSIGSDNDLTSTANLKTNNRLTTHVSATDKLVASVGEEGYLQVESYLDAQYNLPPCLLWFLVRRSEGSREMSTLMNLITP